MVTFLQFPRELRDQIYSCALSAPPRIYIDTESRCELSQSDEDEAEEEPRRFFGALSLLFTNKIIHSETCQMIYSQNVFDFTSCNSDKIQQFLESIGPHNASMIQLVSLIHFRYGILGRETVTFPELDTILEYCKSLKALQLDMRDVKDLLVVHRDRDEPVDKVLNNLDTRLRGSRRTMPTIIANVINVEERGTSWNEGEQEKVKAELVQCMRKTMRELGWEINVEKLVIDEHMDVTHTMSEYSDMIPNHLMSPDRWLLLSLGESLEATLTLRMADVAERLQPGYFSYLGLGIIEIVEDVKFFNFIDFM